MILDPCTQPAPLARPGLAGHSAVVGGGGGDHDDVVAGVLWGEEMKARQNVMRASSQGGSGQQDTHQGWSLLGFSTCSWLLPLTSTLYSHLKVSRTGGQGGEGGVRDYNL